MSDFDLIAVEDYEELIADRDEWRRRAEAAEASFERLRAAAKEVCVLDAIGKAAPSWDALPPDWCGRWTRATGRLRDAALEAAGLAPDTGGKSSPS